ncbi:2379_t:CDS:2, partial [Rhizophagus irregularis]
FEAEVGEAIGKGQRKEGATSAMNAKGLLNGFLEYWAGRLLPNQ